METTTPTQQPPNSQPSGGNMPGHEAYSPFPQGHGRNFDADTIVQTAQLADRSIFVTPSGTYRVERVQENPAYPPHHVQNQHQNQNQNQHQHPQSPAHLQHGTFPAQYYAPQARIPEQQPLTSATGFHIGNSFMGQPGQYQNSNPNPPVITGPIQHPVPQSNAQYPMNMAPAPLNMARSQPPPQQRLPAHSPSVIRRRPVSTPSPAPSTASSGSHQLSPQQGGLKPGGEVVPISPIGTVNDLAGQMSEMHIQNEYSHGANNYGNMAMPMSAGPVEMGYQGQWQGGLPVVSESGEGHQGGYIPYRPPPPASSGRYVQLQPVQPIQQPQYQYPPGQVSPQTPSQYTPQPPSQMSPGGMYPQAYQNSPPLPGPYQHAQQVPAPQQGYYQYRHKQGLSTVSSIPSLTDGPSTRSNSVAYSTAEGRIPIINDTNEGPRVYPVDQLQPPMDTHFDLQTPVLVVPNSPKQPILHQKTQSDVASQRDNVRPGEDLVFESEPGLIKTCPVLTGPFMDAVVKVFRNDLSNELRFYVKVGFNSETYWMKGKNAQLVPLYAFDQRARNMIYVRDKTSLATAGSNPNEPPPTATGPGPQRPTSNFQFTHLADLFQFQGRLTGEDVILDISTVRLLKLCKLNSRDNTTFSSVRVQLWHEPRSRRTMSSDTASIVTAGTALSGPVREKVVANSSRLLVFLGRTESYITVFVTDDIEIEKKKGATVKLKPRKYGGLSRAKSRGGVLGRLDSKRGSEPAGLDIEGKAFDPDMEYSFDVYKTFELEFENEQSSIDFCQSWDEVMAARRKQRSALMKIQEDLKGEALTAKEARKIFL